MRFGFENPPGPLPTDWAKSGHAPGSAFMQWYGGSPAPGKTAQASLQGARTGKHNAEGGTCPILGHRYRSLMERRFGLWLLWQGYRRWTDKDHNPPAGGKWYAYERKDWEFPGIKGKNYHYTADYECWPALVDLDTPGAPLRPYGVYEVKGWMDKDSEVKIKRMHKHYPGVPLTVVDKRVFEAYTHGADLVVPGWNDHPRKAVPVD